MTTSYKTNKSNIAAVHRSVIILLNSYFIGGLISTPTFSITPDQITIHLFYFVSTKSTLLTKLSNKSIQTLADIISRLYSACAGYQGVSVELRFVRLQQPYQNSYILAQYLSLNASKYRFSRLFQALLGSVPLLSHSSVNEGVDNTGILGVKVQLSGLLTTQRNAPRKTVSTATVGTFHGNNTSVEYASSTSKSRVGAFTVKV